MEDKNKQVGNNTLSAPSRRKRKTKKRIGRGLERRHNPWVMTLVILFAVYLGLVLAGAAVFGISIATAYGEVQTARDYSEEFQFDLAVEHLDEAEQDFKQAGYGLFLLNLVKPIPYVGAQVRGVDAVMNASSEGISVLRGALNVGIDVLDASEDLRSILQEQQNFSFYDLPLETRAKLLNTISGATGDLREMRVRIRLASDELSRLDRLAIAPQIREMVNPIQDVLPDIERSLDFLIPLTSVLQELAGVGEDKQWLVLYLNNSELRPGGGFMGVYGLLLMRDGEIQRFDVEDVYVADALVAGREDYQVDPPYALERYLGVDNWYFRDANWSPDFEASAENATQLLRQQFAHAGQPVPDIDGVIGLTPTVAERILEYLGPIELDGFTFTHENVYDLLQFETQFGFAERGLSVDQRKDLVSRLTDEVLGRLLALPIGEIPTVLNIILDSFSDKQMAVYSSEDRTQGIVENAGWAGVLEVPEQSDALMVVDANLAALKTDPVVERSIKYSVTPYIDRLRARVEITYVHTGAFTGLTTRYRTFTRVFVPEGAELISVQGNLSDDALNNPAGQDGEVVTEQDLGMTSFGAFTSVEPGRQRTLIFEYYLPENVQQALQEDRYDLQVFKQMGAANHALTVMVDSDKNVRTAQPAEERKDRGDDVYSLQTFLDQDKEIKIRY